jgi:RNA polymerase sigma-70 factor (ECF subfamily)
MSAPPSNPPTPASLLERLRQPTDQEAWGRFVDLYGPLIYSWGRHAGLQDPDTADLVQDVLLALVQALPNFTYDRHRSFRRWLRTITFNKWRDRRKKHGTQPLPGGADGLEDVASPEDPDAFWEAEYRRHLIDRVLQVMKADFRPATWKACWEYIGCGRPAAEVAAELGLTTGAVYAASCRVLGRLREELAGLLD